MLFKKSIANFLTILNIIFGFIAIILVLLSIDRELATSLRYKYLEISCYMIFISSTIDVFDGKVARWLGTSGEFGKQIDSLADLVSFCLFPSVLLFGFFYFDKSNPVLSDWFIYLTTSFPLIFGAIRLARFNAYEEQSEGEYYLGLPTPANGILVCSMILFCLYFISSEPLNENNISYNVKIIPIIISIFSSMLLVSDLKYSKFPLLKINVSFKNNLYLASMVLFIIALLFGTYYGFTILVLVIFILYYIILGILKLIIDSVKTMMKG